MAAAQSPLARLPVAARFGIGAALVVLVGVAYWLIFYTEVDGKIEAAKRQQNQLNTELATQQRAQADYFKDRDDLIVHQQQQRELNKQLPTDSEPASFLSAIQQVSNLSGVDLKAWQPVDEKNEAFYAKVPMKLEFGGKFHQIAKFAYEMGKVERIINLENIELTDPKLDGDEIKLKVKCLATTFRLRTAKPAARPGQPAQPAQAEEKK